jgi:hypothetical protein
MIAVCSGQRDIASRMLSKVMLRIKRGGDIDKAEPDEKPPHTLDELLECEREPILEPTKKDERK